MTRTAVITVAGAAWIGAWLAPPWPAALVGLALLAALSRGGRRRGEHVDGVDRGPWRLVGVVAAVGLLAGGLAGGRVAQRDAGPLHDRVGGPPVALVVRLVSEPEPVRDRAWAVVRVERVDGQPARARALAWVPEHAPLGATLALRARAGPLPDGGFGAHLRARGAGLQLRPSGPVEVVAEPAWALRATTVLRERVRAAARAGLDDDPAALLSGLTTGDGRDRSAALDARLRAAGLSHLVVVSGRHTAVFLGAVLAVCALLGASFRGTRWTALGALGWFVVLVRWQPSVLRAAAVAGIALAADLLGRERDVVRVLAGTVVALLLLDPLLAQRLGFALSVAATGGVLVGIRLADRIPLPRPVAVAVGAAVGAQAAVTPLLLAGGLDGAGPGAVPANLVAAPAAGLAQLVGAAVAIVSLVDVGAASWAARLAGPPLCVVLAAAGLADVVTWSLLVAGAALLAAVAVASQVPRRPAVLAAAAACAVLLVVVSVPRAPRVSALTLTAFDAGQGDAVLVESPGALTARDTARMLVDAGPQPQQVAGQLVRRGVRTLAVAVITHAHADHVGGMAGVLERLRVGRLLVGPVTAAERGGSLAEVLDVARRRHVPVAEVLAGDRLQLGSAVVEVLWPRAGALGPANDRSVVLRVVGPTGRLLLTGDVEAAGQRRLLRDPARLAADVVKVPHHGADTNAEGFLEAVGARVAVVTVGAGNDYGHPAAATIADLRTAETVRTDLHGTVVVVLHADGQVIRRARSPPSSHPLGILRTQVRQGELDTVLHVHRAARADVLVDALADALAEPPDDPFTPEVVAVHSRGIERWLMQQLSGRLGASERGDGVAANVEFPFPGSLVARVLAELDGGDPDVDPWRPARLAWTVLDALDDVLTHVRCGALRRQLDDDPGRRFSVARHLADLFDRYAAHRPAMVCAWADGRHLDSTGAPLEQDDVWQAVLWQAVRARVGTPSTAERLARVDELADAGVAARVTLPARLLAFGVTAVPVAYLDVLGALAVQRDVGLWIVHPSRALWKRVAELRLRGRPRRADDPTAEAPHHPLIRSWGRDVRELQVALGGIDHDVTHHDDAPRPGTVLGVLQSGIERDAAPPGPPGPFGGPDRRRVVDADDRSVQVHACWGAERQVEVLRDEILRLLEQHEDLEPRDIVVLCPDIERYAPLVQAVLVDVDAQTTGLPDLRVRLADRSLTRVNPVLQVVMDVLELADRRCTVEQLLALASREVVQRRFELDAEDVELLGWWIDDLGVKWGLDDVHRAQHGLAGVGARTWRGAVERLLVGAVASDRDLRVVGDVAPYEEVTADVELAGRFAELVARVEWAVDELAQPRDVQGWREVLLRVADAFVDPGSGRDGDVHDLQRVVDRLVRDATGPAGPSPAALRLDEVRDALGPRLAARPSRANHRTGDLTVCTLVPMRAVPHRVVCLLGMDDGAFPRHVVPDGDDLLDRAPIVGDRDARTEDRQLLLDAVMSATETLVVTYSAHDLRTGEDRQPAVPIAELLAALAESAVTADGRDLQVHRTHPLQPHAPAVFDPDDQPGFDRVAYAAARAAAAPPRPRPPFVTEDAGRSGDEQWSPAQLRRTLEHPIREYVRSTLKVRLAEVDENDTTTVPAELGGLVRWSVVDGLLRQRLAGGDVERWERHLRARDLLPPGRLGSTLLDESGETVDQLTAVARAEGWRPPAAVDVDVDLGAAHLIGEVGDVVGPGCLVAVTASTVRERHLLRLWVDVLVLTLTEPDVPWSGVVVGTRSGWNKGLQVARCPALPGTAAQRVEQARAELLRLVGLADRALRRPLPLFTTTSHAYARTLVEHEMHRDTAIAKAEQRWQPEHGRAEQRDPYHRLVLGGDVPLADILDGASPCTGGDFEALALELWTPVLAHTTSDPVTKKELERLAGAA